MGIGKIRNDLNFDDFSLKPVGLYLAINIPHRCVYCTRAFPNFVSLLQKRKLFLYILLSVTFKI